MTLRALVVLTAALLGASSVQAVQPSTEVAAQRGPYIFNAVFDSLRRYGTAFHYNGMSLYLATVPEGVFFHHGSGKNATPTSFDWLAYEIEHAEIFARQNFGSPGKEGRPDDGERSNGMPGESSSLSVLAPSPHHRRVSPFVGLGRSDQIALDGHDRDSDEGSTKDEEETHGWLHIYRTTRPLQFLYIDGMSGDKGSGGVIDTQDYLLRAETGMPDPAERPKPTPGPKPPGAPPGPAGEFSRAEELCALCAQWQLQGVIRTEGAGTEIIKCDFFDGLEEVQSLQRSDNAKRPRFPSGPPRGFSGTFNPEYGFRDIGAHRTVLDYQSMVSAFFFPVNLTNPDSERASFPRLISASNDELVAIKAYLADVVEKRRCATLAPYNWRDVADLVVRRYASPLTALANSSSESANAAEDFSDAVQLMLNIFVDFSVTDAKQREAEALDRCAKFYVRTQEPLTTEADKLISAGFEAVNAKICETLFNALHTVAGKNNTDGTLAVETAKASITALIAHLDWSVFERDLERSEL
ncbi:hypothetical protein SEPCBS57363_005399 [Sporothrix epigloea]|uniref:Uncharacterized protein n=1 Tax=Sporothrix epigloea TaxID=1892477 RepID=A0ABP0E0B2_9PEZI